MVQFANVVVYSYQYLLDPKVAGIISKEMQRESVVVFDEAHNIDNVCIEALSVSVRSQTLEGATRNLNKMSQEVERYAPIFNHYVCLFVDLGRLFCFMAYSVDWDLYSWLVIFFHCTKSGHFTNICWGSLARCYLCLSSLRWWGHLYSGCFGIGPL